MTEMTPEEDREPVSVPGVDGELEPVEDFDPEEFLDSPEEDSDDEA